MYSQKFIPQSQAGNIIWRTHDKRI